MLKPGEFTEDDDNTWMWSQEICDFVLIPHGYHVILADQVFPMPGEDENDFDY